MNKKEKSKKSLLHRILKWTGISFLGILIILILIPVLFKNQIKDLVIEEVNKSLNAKLSMKDFDLTFIKTFPNMTIELHQTKLVGVDRFKDVELASIKKFQAHVGFWDVVGGDQITINEIHLEEPNFDVRVLSDGSANYDIVKPDSLKKPEEIEEPSNFKLSLKEYSITNANISYVDRPSGMNALIKNLNHNGKGDLTQDVVDFETTTLMDALTFEMGNIAYFNEVKTDIIANIKMEFGEKNSKFTLNENVFKLNALEFSIDGFYEMLENSDKMDLKLNASKTAFKDLLSLIPAFYHTGYENMVTKGNLELGAHIKGEMDDKNMPAWDFNMAIADASIKYPDVPGMINNIFVKVKSNYEGGSNLDKMTLDVERFHANFVGNSIDASLKMRNPMTDPLLVSKILAKVDLGTLQKVMPLGEESYQGKLDADIQLNGRMSAIENEKYEQFKALGTLKLSNMLYKSKDLPDAVSIAEMIFRFSPQFLALEKLNGKMGESDFQLNGKIDNYLAYLFRNELLKGNFAYHSDHLNLDQLMASNEEATPEQTTTETPSSSTSTAIPKNIDFLLQTSVNDLLYNKIKIKTVSGNVRLKEGIASLENLKLNTMGGSIGVNGNFNTQDPDKPKVDFAYQLKDINIHELASNFLSVGKLAPIAKYAKGKISSNFEMKSDLTASLEPNYNSLTGKGDFGSNMLTISGFKPMEKIGNALMMNNLSNQTIKDIKAKFKFTDGKVFVAPFNVNLGKIKTNITGSTSFLQEINYNMDLLIPREEIPQAMLKNVEQAISKLNKVSPKLDQNILPENLKVKLNLLGSVTDPKVSTNFKEALMEATGNVKDALVNQVKQTAKDTIKAIVGEKTKEIKEDLNAKKQQILNEAQKNADKVKVESKKSADLVRAEADKQVNALMNEAGSNPIKKKSAELAGKKIRKEAEEKAVKIEQEGVKKADQIMEQAHQKANQI